MLVSIVILDVHVHFSLFLFLLLLKIIQTFLFSMDADSRFVSSFLSQVLQEAKQAVNPKLQEIADRFGGGGGGGRSYGSRGRGGGGYRNGW